MLFFYKIYGIISVAMRVDFLMEMWQNDNIQNQDKQNLWAHLACHFFFDFKNQ